MTLSIGSVAPDFTADTTQGPIKFHDFIGDGYAILFSHPKDYTPVCTTELGYMAGLADEFAKRNTKIIGLSVDPVGAHEGWLQDIKDVTGNTVDYPIIADHDLKVAKLYNMLPADAGETSEGRTAATNATVRTVYMIGPDKLIKAMLHLSDEHGTELRRGSAAAEFDPAYREAFGGDAGELEAGRGLHHRAVAFDEAAREKFPNGWKTVKPYLGRCRSRSKSRSRRTDRLAGGRQLQQASARSILQQEDLAVPGPGRPRGCARPCPTGRPCAPGRH